MPGSFNGSTSRIIVSTYSALQWADQFTPFTYSVKLRLGLLGTLQLILDQGDGTTNRLVVRLRQINTDKLQALLVQQNVVALASVESTTTMSLDTEVNMIIRNDGTNLELYIDGVFEATDAIASGTVLAASGDFHIGQLYTGANRFDGDIGEVTIWNVALTASEIESIGKGTNPSQVRADKIVLYVPVENSGSTEANLSPISDANNGTATDITAADSFTTDDYFSDDPLYSHDALVTPWYDASWNKRNHVRVSQDMVVGTTDKSEFVLLVRRTDAEFAAARADGFDFVVTQNDGTTKLKHEIVKWDNVGNELVLFVKVPTLYALQDTGLWLYYDNPAAADQQDITNTWPATYKMVHHLNDNFLDSTSNDNDATEQGTTKVDGLVGDARDFNNSSDKIEIPDDPSLQFATANRITLIAAFKINTFTSVDKVVTKAKNGSPYGPFEMRLTHTSGNNKMDCTLATGGTEHLMNGTTVLNNTDKYVAILTYDGATIKWFVDENLDDSLANSDTIDDSTQIIMIGNHPQFSSGDLKGAVDEVHLLDSAMPDDTAKTLVRNWKEHDTHITFGVQESLGQVVKVIADSMSLSEAPLIIKIVKVLQSLGITDDSKIAKVVRLLENISLSDISTVPGKIIKFLSNVAISHVVSASKLVRIAESLSVSSIVTRISDIIKVITDSLSVSHVISIPGKIAKITNTLNISEAVSKIAPSITKMVTDSLSLSENIKTSKIVKVAESLLTDTTAKLTKLVHILQSLSFSDVTNIIKPAPTTCNQVDSILLNREVDSVIVSKT